MRVLKSLAIIAVLTTMISCGNQKPDAKSLETEIDSASYALGMDMAIKVKANFDKANTDLFLQGYRNGMDSTDLLIEQKELNNFLRTFFQKLQADKMKEAREKAAKEAETKYGHIKKAGEEFLALNKVKEGVDEHSLYSYPGKGMRQAYFKEFADICLSFDYNLFSINVLVKLKKVNFNCMSFIVYRWIISNIHHSVKSCAFNNRFYNIDTIFRH